jgi:hypothetical protein
MLWIAAMLLTPAVSMVRNCMNPTLHCEICRLTQFPAMDTAAAATVACRRDYIGLMTLLRSAGVN